MKHFILTFIFLLPLVGYGVEIEVTKEQRENFKSGADLRVTTENGESIGYLIAGIKKDSDFSKSGLMEGDLIVGLNGKDASGSENIVHVYKALMSADVLDFKVIRPPMKIPIEIQVKFVEKQ